MIGALVYLVASSAVGAYTSIKAAEYGKGLVNAATDTAALRKTAVSWGGRKKVIVNSADWYAFLNACAAVDRMVDSLNPPDDQRDTIAYLIKKSALRWPNGDGAVQQLLEDEKELGLERMEIAYLLEAFRNASPQDRAMVFHFCLVFPHLSDPPSKE